MAKVRVFIVHDETGRIVSVNRPAEGASAVILSGEGHSIWATEVDEHSVATLIAKYRVDIGRNLLVNTEMHYDERAG